MSFIKRAILHTVRKLGKSTLLFLVLLIMSILILTCLSIRSATETAELNVRESLGGTYSIAAKRTKGQITYDVLDKISKIKGVKKIENGHSESYAEYKSQDGNKLETKTTDSDIEDIKGFEHVGKLQSNMYSEKDEFFKNKTFKLLEGRHITKGDKNVLLVHKDFAKRNNLSIGDQIILDLNEALIKDTGYSPTQIKVKIIGIYEHTTEQETAMNVSYTLYENTVFTDQASFVDLHEFGKTPYYSDIEVVVDDPAKLDSIVNEMKLIDNVNWDLCRITYHDTDYQNAKKPLDSLNSLVTISIIIIIIVAISLIVLILVMWIRNRVYETGVFMSMGFSKANILLQHLTEILLIAIIAFSLSFPISSLISGQVGSALLGQSGNGINKLTQLNVNVSIENFILMYVIGVLLIVVSVIISTLPILKMKPKEILSTLS